MKTLPDMILKSSKLEEAFAAGLRMYGSDLPKPERELSPIPGRKFRFDFGWRAETLLVEINGGIFSKGRSAHTGASLVRDFAKQNAATVHGWRLLVFGPRDVEARKLPETVATVRAALSLPTEAA